MSLGCTCALRHVMSLGCTCALRHVWGGRTHLLRSRLGSKPVPTQFCFPIQMYSVTGGRGWGPGAGLGRNVPQALSCWLNCTRYSLYKSLLSVTHHFVVGDFVLR